MRLLRLAFYLPLLLLLGCPPQTQQLSISTPFLLSMISGQPYQITFTANGGTPPYTWTATGLPSWLTLSSSGTLSGNVPADATGRFVFTITVHDGAKQLSQNRFVLHSYADLQIFPAERPVSERTL